MRRGSVSVDDEKIHHVRADDTEVTIAWKDLDAVSLQTTDKGPIEDDLFWVLRSKGDDYAIPSETPGVTYLMRALQALPGFDNEAVIDASTMLEPGIFECWRRRG